MRKKISTIVVAMILVVPILADLNLTLPKQNQASNVIHSSNYTSTAVETSNGLKILRRLRSSGNIIEDPEINTWIRSIGNRLTANASHSSSPFYFLVSKNLDVNAFATSGGVVVINAGLILLSSSESELAAVLSHEIAHITQRHISRIIDKANGNKLATNVAILAGLLAGSQNPEAGQAILNTAIATMAHKQLAFGRVAEAEADRVGLRILASSGFDPNGMPQFLQKLESSSDNKYDDVREFLQNHPLTHKRVSDTRSRAKRYNKGKYKENVSFLYMREKVRAITKSTKPALTTLPQPLKRYSKAMQLFESGSYQNALKHTGLHSKKVSEAILIAKLHNKRKDYQKTINLLIPLTEVFLDEVSIILPLARAYIAINKPENAWDVLKGINASEQTSLEYFEVKQEAARLTGNISQAYYAVASKNIRMGAYKAAKTQLQQAIRFPGSSYLGLQKMQQELNQLEN